MIGLLLPMFYDHYTYGLPELKRLEAQAQEVVKERPEVKVEEEILIEIRYDWTKERIEQEIRSVFPEDPEMAIKVAKCESGLRMIQSNHMRDGVQEPSFGIFQIHDPSWLRVAKKMDLDYRNNVKDNITMARHIYDNAGKKWNDWSCYTKKMI